MRNSSIPFTACALAAALAGCAPYDAVTSVREEPIVVVSPSAAGGSTAVPAGTAQPGSGVIESLSAVASPGTSRTWGADTHSMWRVGVRMDDGSTRTVDTLAENIALGKRVSLTSDGKLDVASNAPVQVAQAPVATASAVTGGSADTSTTAPAGTTTVHAAMRPGAGRVESINAVPAPASAGTLDGKPIVSMWRVGVRMDDGSNQTIDTMAKGLMLGKRVQIASDGRNLQVLD
jgi:hypothetical protein